MSTARSSLVMAAGTVVSRILGFTRAVLLALTIGVTTDAADAFGVANQLPNNVYAIIAGGVLNAVLVPQIIRARKHKDGGQTYINRLVTMIITGFTIVTVVTTIAAPFLVALYTTGWSTEQLALATAFAYWCLPQLFFYGLYSLFGEILNARSAFGPFMWAPVLNNIVAISGMVAFVVLFGADPTGTRAVGEWGAEQVSLLAATATAGVASQALKAGDDDFVVDCDAGSDDASVAEQWPGFDVLCLCHLLAFQFTDHIHKRPALVRGH